MSSTAIPLYALRKNANFFCILNQEFALKTAYEVIGMFKSRKL